MSNAPTARQIIAEAKAAGYTIKNAGKLNGATAYKVTASPEGQKQWNPFALWTAKEIGRDILGYPI